MKVLTVVGRASDLIRAAALHTELRDRCDPAVIDATVRRDDELAGQLQAEAGISLAGRIDPGPGTDGERTAAVLSALEPIVAESAPDALVALGDSDAALAASLVGAKAGVTVVRPEAGVRSGDRTAPDEVNRVAADSLADLRLCPTDAALAALRREGLAEEATVVGDLTPDAAALINPIAEASSKVYDVLGLEPGSYLFASVQRRSNLATDESVARILDLCSRIADAAGDPVVLPLPSRFHSRLDDSGERDRLRRDGLALVERTGHLDTVRLLIGARVLVADSGDLQREAFAASVPAITLERHTPWTETVETGWNRLVGLDPDAAVAALAELPGRETNSPAAAIYGEGAAARVAAKIAEGR